METYDINCPHCGGTLEVQEDWSGMETECPLCQNAFVIPPRSKPLNTFKRATPPPPPPPPPPPIRSSPRPEKTITVETQDVLDETETTEKTPAKVLADIGVSFALIALVVRVFAFAVCPPWAWTLSLFACALAPVFGVMAFASRRDWERVDWNGKSANVLALAAIVVAVAAYFLPVGILMLLGK